MISRFPQTLYQIIQGPLQSTPPRRVSVLDFSFAWNRLTDAEKRVRDLENPTRTRLFSHLQIVG